MNGRKSISFSDLFPPTPAEIERQRFFELNRKGEARRFSEMSDVEILEYFVGRYEMALFNYEVDLEMERSGFAELNRRTLESERLSERDYMTYVNC